jgi:hypothetical protein
LELSYYLSKNDTIKKKLITIINSNINSKDKKHELQKILLTIMNSSLAKEYKLFNPDIKNSIAFLIKSIPDLKTYVLSNLRDYCHVNKTENKCIANPHCLWKNNTCNLQILDTMAIDCVNKVIEELLEKSIKYKEIMEEGDYYVSDIVDYSQFTYRDNQKILKASNYNINIILLDMFGKDKIPIIGRKRFFKNDVDIVKEDYPELIHIGNMMSQQIISNKDTIIRAFANSYYWMNNSLYDMEYRNLGYYSELQTNLTSILKALIIDFIQNNTEPKILQYVQKYFKKTDSFFDSTLNKFRKSQFNTDGHIELFVLSHIIDVPIIVYDNYSNIKYIYLQGEIDVNKDTEKKFTSSEKIKNSIVLKFVFDGSNKIPNNVFSLYTI